MERTQEVHTAQQGVLLYCTVGHVLDFVKDCVEIRKTLGRYEEVVAIFNDRTARVTPEMTWKELGDALMKGRG